MKNLSDLFINRAEGNPLYERELMDRKMREMKPKQNKVSDLFKPNNYLEQECKIVERRPIMLNAAQENKLENARKLEQMFENSRVATSVTKDNNTAVDVKLEYSKNGKYFKGFSDNVFINKVTKIEQNDYIPSSAIKSYLNVMYECYSIYIGHASGQDVEVARVVFAY